MSRLFSTENEGNIIARHSFYEARSPKELVPSTSETSRSDFNIIRTKDFPSIIDSGCVNRYGLPVGKASSEEYYKKYEHDDVPVKDGSCGDNKELTNSDLDKMEVRIFKNISKELQTDESSTDDNGLESNIKLFKMTVQEIFDNFYNNRRDYDLYKKKFEALISQSKYNSVKEMEDFIKEMIKHIIPSESCKTSVSDETNFKTFGTEVESNTLFPYSEDHEIKMQNGTVEAYINENYLTDSTFEKESSKTNHTGKSEHRDKTYNIYLLGGDRCLKIKMDGRSLLSEINIRNQYTEEADQVASAENIKSVARKKLQLQKYMTHRVECKSNDEIIPVKVSYAKKNIHSEDCSETIEESNQFFIFKFCKYLCKKLRKN